MIGLKYFKSNAKIKHKIILKQPKLMIKITINIYIIIINLILKLRYFYIMNYFILYILIIFIPLISRFFYLL